MIDTGLSQSEHSIFGPTEVVLGQSSKSEAWDFCMVIFLKTALGLCSALGCEHGTTMNAAGSHFMRLAQEKKAAFEDRQN